MSRETPKDIYTTKVTPYGNGAKLKAYKSQIGEEVVIMPKSRFDKLWKDIKAGKVKKISDKDFDEVESKLAETWED